MTFAQKLTLLMTQRGLTQDGLANELSAFGTEISQRAVSNWLAGSIPRSGALKTIGDFFEVDPALLINVNVEIPASAWERMKSSNLQSQNKYPDNKQAAEENFDAQLFENAAQKAMLAHASSLRGIAKELKDQADSLVQKANQIEAKIPAVLVSQTPHPKPNKKPKG